MARIVPSGYRTGDSHVARALVDELNFIVGVDPTAAATAVSSAFTQTIGKQPALLQHLRPRSPGSFPERARLTHVTATPHDRATPSREDLDGAPVSAGIISHEIDPALQEVLFDTGLAYMGERIIGGA
ncbi:DUF6236 family protein [Nonomuraea sp. NPDC005692]|uniref:DUF6236 family protein n=1 Tax=Nonomuraea sp. NPDC005692 TaxID=3157168 RepID=UPI00340CD9DB